MAPKARPAGTAGRRAPKNAPDGLGTMGKMAAHAAVLAVLLAAWAAWRGSHPALPLEITPLKAPKLKQLPEFDAQYKASMLWGSYRSGLYFGMRTRTSRPLLMGLMWFDATHPHEFTEGALRHEAQQQDRLTSYGWLRHDGRTYGRQQIIDGPLNITIQMVKQQSEGAGYGGDWAVRITTALTQEGRAAAEAAKAEAAAAAAAGDAERAALAGRAAKRRLSLLLHFADAHWHTSRLELWPQSQQGKLGEGIELLGGDNEEVGPWALHLLPAPSAPGGSSPSKASSAAKLRFLGMRLQDGQQLVALKGLVAQALVQTAQRLGFASGVKLWLPNHNQPDANLAVFQVNAAVPAQFDLVFVTKPEDSSAGARLAALSGDALTSLAASREAAFDERFRTTFPISDTDATTTTPVSSSPTTPAAAEAGAGGASADTPSPAAAAVPLGAPQLEEVSKAALSNLLGSMGYWVGASIVKLPPGVQPPTPASALPPGADPSIVPYWRDALFSATPSRSFFPRGFLWDEGFHQLLVARWDAQLSRDAIAHWLDLMNAAGWIPREQILGKEARARVPPEFVVQHPAHANPPSLYLPLMLHAAVAAQHTAATAAGSKGGAGAAAAGGDDGDAAEAARSREFLARAWPRLEVWYRWFNTSQAGQLPGSYMWKGRDASTVAELNPKTLMSGLDDYPRASHPTPAERHIDLLAWMVLASRAMAEIGAAAGAPAKAVARYASAAQALGSLQRLKALHFEPTRGTFLDYGLHTEAVKMEWVDVPVPDGQPPKRELVRQVLDRPSLQHVPSYGYVSLFPLLMQLLPPDSDDLGAQLALLTDEALLWTPHGLRSLAPTSSMYKQYNTEHDAPYWRGQIWVNINFLALRALRHYAAAAGPHQAAAAGAYQRLRANLLSNLVRQYNGTGYLWEQYDDTDGTPKGSHPFTGWTALLTLVASEVF